MTSIDIYAVLSSKSHNPHYLKRYIKFINWCKEKNKVLDESVYTEEHHIAPKAKDLFPEYSDFTHTHKWNKVELTFPQHIIAHVILWKCYGGSQAQALECMLALFNEFTNKYLCNRKIPNKIVRRYLETLKLEANAHRGIYHVGMSTYKDAEGKNYYLHRDDSKIHELNLKHIKAGTTHSVKAKMRMANAKWYMKTVMMYFLNCRKRVRIYSDKFEQYLAQGWTTKLSAEDAQYTAEMSSAKKTSKMSGRTHWANSDGTYFGFISKDNPLVEKLNLKLFVSDNMKKQRAGAFQNAAKEANTGSQFYNNGLVCKKFKTNPGHPWKLGQLVRDRSAQKEACSKRKGKLSWNDGINTTYALESPGEGWMRGMAPRK